MRRWKLFVSVISVSLMAAACGGGEEAAPADPGAAPTTPPADGTAPAADATTPAASPTDAATPAPDGGDFQAAMVTDVGGLGDQSFNDSAFAGLQRAEDELGVQIEVLESGAPTDYVSNLTQLAQSGFSPVFAVGFLMTDALTQVAPQFPDTTFSIIDSVVEEPNVVSVGFSEQQGSYLAGIVAGLMTQEDTDYTAPDDMVVGFLGGQESPLIERFEAGYTAGVYSVCPDCEVLSQYAGTTPDAFNDPAAGREIALNMSSDGADIIFHASGATGAGLFEVAAEESFFAIGVDSDQAQLFPDLPILTSMLKRVDNAVFEVVRGAVEGDIPTGEVVTYGLEEEGVGLAPFYDFEDVVPEEVTTAVDEARQAMIDGELEAPATMGDVEQPS